jgi:hypothetical protein
VSPSLSGIVVSARSDGAHFSSEVPRKKDFFYSLNAKLTGAALFAASG